MKFLLLLLVILLGAWLWRSSRRVPPPAEHGPPAAPQDMVACALCGTHVPRGEAEAGKHGLYCSVEHRQRAEP